jgi:Protein of unknown function (DUF3667)
MSHAKHQYPNCLNCHYPLAGFDNFCPNCGQKPMSPKSSMHDLLHEFFHTFWHLDGKFFMTLHHLLIPGKLTTEFFKGHLKRYAHPIQLFLVLGAFAFGTLASKTHKAEEKAQESVEQRRDEYKRKAFLKELDSVRQTLVPPQYSDAKTTLLSDSLMFKMIYTEGIELNKEQLGKEADKILDKEFDKRYGITRNQKRLSVGKKDSSVVAFSIEYEDDGIRDHREAFKDSIIDALIEFEKKSFEVRMTERVDSTRKERHEKGGWKEVADDFNKGYKVGGEEAENRKLLEKLRPKIEEQKRKRNLKEAIIMQEDTNNISIFGDGLKLPTREIYELSPDEIIEKYKVKGFWQKIGLKQGLKATQDAGNLIHFYMSKLFWATVCMLPALALFFSLVYWRQKRFYVEHIVFLLHFNTTAFLVLIPTLWISTYYPKIGSIYAIWFMIHFVASIKGYYKQGWLKTLLKSFIIGLAYMFIGTIFVTIGAIIGLIFF